MRRLRRRVDIYRESSDDGAEVPTYTRWMADVPVDIVQVTGGETYRGRQVESTTTHMISVRYLSGLLPTMRLTDTVASVNYHIERIGKRDGRDHMIDLQCREVVL